MQRSTFQAVFKTLLMKLASMREAVIPLTVNNQLLEKCTIEGFSLSHTHTATQTHSVLTQDGEFGSV